jgi:hypothetical protein
MILEQLQIAPEIVRIAFTAIMFALALGLALAFGLGGRELAADLLRQAKDKGSQAADQAKHDARVGADRARDEMGGHSGGSYGNGASSTATTTNYPTSVDPEATQHMTPPAPPNR